MDLCRDTSRILKTETPLRVRKPARRTAGQGADPRRGAAHGGELRQAAGPVAPIAARRNARNHLKSFRFFAATFHETVVETMGSTTGSRLKRLNPWDQAPYRGHAYERGEKWEVDFPFD